MKERTRRILIMAVMAALIVSLMAASLSCIFTYGRYAGGRRDENSPYEDYIDFVGATAFTVQTPEELTNAIENGYSYIEIDDNAENPFVVNDDIANVTTNLVLDVNGKTVIRNSRNPLLDVKRSVSVVLVYDSSTEQEGGFYNPVGSALQTSGGTLTVGAGVYESGPKTGIASSLPVGSVEATIRSRTSRTSPDGYSVSSSASMPALSKDVYLPKDWKGTENDFIEADTYFIYSLEQSCYEIGDQLYVNAVKEVDESGSTVYTGDAFAVPCNVASCDFYYYYPVGGTEGTQKSPAAYAVVYGYNDVKNMAADVEDMATALVNSGLVWPYAAIRSEAGNTHARGGEFKTHFGTQNTYGIYSKGGEMTVGTDSANSAPSFTATGAGVCVRMSGDKNNTLTISSGSFSSEIGNTIQMEGGAMTVTRGSFTKSGGKGIAGGDNAQITNQTAIIDIQGGTLTINGAAANSVTLTAGSADTDNGGTLENVFGILARGGEVSVGGCTLNIYGDYSAGVLSYDGTINLNDNTKITVTQSETATVLTSAGVSSEQASGDGEHPVNLLGNVTITSNGLGITARGTVNVKKETSTVTTYRGSTVTTSRGTGIYVNNGSFTVDIGAEITVNSTVKSGCSWATPPGTTATNTPNIYNGVYVQGGSLISNGKLNVTFTGVENESHEKYDELKIRSYAVRVETAASGGKTEVSIAGGTISNSVGGGVYVGGGTVTLGVRGEGGPTIGTTGVSFGDENTSAGGGNWKYYENETGGHAVEVSGGDLLVYGGLYTAALGNGILVRGGDAWVLNGTFQGNDTGDYRYNYGGNLPAGPAAYYALKLLDGSVTTFGGTFGTYVVGEATYTAEGSSAFVTGVSSQATANIFGGSFKVGGQAGFSVYQNVALTFTPKKKVTVGEGSEAQTLQGSAVEVSAATTAIAIENTTNVNVFVTINGGNFESTGTDDGKRDGIWYSNPYAKLTINQLEGQSTKISANEQHGIRLVHAPKTEGGVKITDGTITGAQHGILYVDTTDNGSAASVNDGLLIEGGTIKGTSGSGLYFAVNPWQNGGTNNVAIVGGTFNGKIEKGSDENPFYINGAISAPSSGESNTEYSGLGKQIRLGDILKTHTGDGKVGYVEGRVDWDGNSDLGGNYKYSIAVTVSSMESVSIKLYNQ